MGKFRLDSPQGTPLDPFAFEKQFTNPNLNNPSQFSGVTDQLEFVTPEKIESGYGTLGNASVAAQIIQETKAANQGAIELAGKGLFNVAKTIGVEIGKTPGYLVGTVGAIGNELFGDGKESMSYIVDNAWVNSFEQLDENLKQMIPVHISKQVSEGNLLDKLGSGAWWASTGADGVGFMLAMFAPGAVVKGLNVGSKIASTGEKLANISTKLGKTATGESWLAKLGLMEATPMGFKYTKTFAQNANGYASAAINTVVEASAEAANTFDTLTEKYISQGLSEDQAKLKAGEGAAAVFKGNLALLGISNVLDEKWIWKSIGSGQKEAGQTVLSKIMRDGVVDNQAVNQAAKELSRKAVIKETLKNIGKNFLKEGFYEEGSQTTLQQNIDEGKIEESVFGNLSNVASQYFDDFANNTELHESIFLGGLLGGGASVIGTIQENNALKAALFGSSGRTKENFWVKYGILPETKDQKGLASIIKENHIKQFRSYKDLLTNGELDDQKLVDAQLEQVDQLVTDVKYDLAVLQKDELAKEIYGQFLASNYMAGFLGQEGAIELFEEHVKNQVVPAWQQRFTETHGREPSLSETSSYEQSFKDSGVRILNAYKTAEETNYPERYFSESTKEYQDFRQVYFHKKFQTLVSLDAVKTRKNAILLEPNEKQREEDLKQINLLEESLTQYYDKFFTKAGVKELYEDFKNMKTVFEDTKADIVEENEALKQQAEKIPDNNQQVIASLTENHDLLESIPVVDKNGNVRLLQNNLGEWEIDGKPISKIKTDLSTLGLYVDDVSKDQFEAFRETGEVSEATLDRIITKIKNNKRLSSRELEIADSNADLIKERVAEQVPVISAPIVDEEVSNDTDITIEERDKDKGVYLFPTTGRHLLNERVSLGDVFVEQLNPKVSQQLWFKTLDEDVSQNPSLYTAKVVRLDDKSNEELHKQILRDAGADSQDSDLYVVLYKDGNPVIKNGSDDIKSIEDARSALISKKSTAKEKFEFLESVPVGTIFKSDEDTRIIITPKKILKSGTEEFELITEIFNEKIKQWEIADVNLISKKHTGEYTGEFPTGLLNNSSTNLNTGERIITTPKIILPVNGNYVFTGLWRPENLYPEVNGKPKKIILAEKVILENFWLEHGLTSDINSLSNDDKLILSTLNVEPTQEGILTAAFKLAKKEYTEWYRNLQASPQTLQVGGITKGHRLKAYDENGNEMWRSPLKSIPGIKLKSSQNPSASDLKNGKLLLSTTGFIKVGHEEIRIASGDTVLVDNDLNVHALRARLLTEDEARTVAYILSLRAEKGKPTESFMVETPSAARFGTLQMTKIPVFFNETPKMSRANLIESLISFGSKNGGKGEIYFNQESIATEPILVWTDFSGETHNMPVKKLKQAIEKEDFKSIENLLVFLRQKRFNVNEHLLGTTETNGNPIFHKPSLTYMRDTTGKRVPTLQWDSSKSYYEHLLKDVLTTNTFQAPEYPKRVQRNIWFNKQPVQEEVFSDLTWGEETTKPVRQRRTVGSLDKFKDDADVLRETVTGVDKVIEESVTSKEIEQIAVEENIRVSEVKEKIKSEVVSQMNNPTKPKTLLQKVAVRVKKLLLSIFLVGSMLHISSFTFNPSSASLAYDKLKVENLQSFDNVYLDQEAINKKDNINIITTSQKDSSEPYMIVDKKVGMVHIFEGENLISSAEVGVGENVGDDQTILKSLFFDSRGRQVSANEAITVSNGNSYLRDGYSSRINWDDGNKSTGAGIYIIARKGDYHGSTGYFLKNERGISVPMALHKVTNAIRARKISDRNPNNNRVSNGCINFNIADIESLSNKGIKVGTKIFVLPDNPNNKYSIVDNKLRFISNQSSVNKTVVPYEALPITLKVKNVNDDGKEFLQALSDNKKQLMKLYPSVSNDIYNQITRIAYGIFGQESSYGTFGGVRGKFGMIKDEIASILTNEDISVGVTQIRFGSVNDKTRTAFNITSTIDLKNSITKSAIATMSLLLDMYESQIPGNLKSDFRELLPLGYSNRTEFSKGIKGDTEVYNNKYVKNVIAYGNQVSIYLGSSEIPQVTKLELNNSRKTDSANKILTTPELLKQKLKSGEIIQNCK